MSTTIRHPNEEYPYFQGIPLYKVNGGFKFLYDGFMSVASELVKIVENSQGFTLREYPGQAMFYDNFFYNIDQLRLEIKRIVA